MGTEDNWLSVPPLGEYPTPCVSLDETTVVVVGALGGLKVTSRGASFALQERASRKSGLAQRASTV